MTPGAFLDTGIFVAFMNGRDRWHLNAVSLFNGAKPRWSTSILVLSEAYSWFLHRMGEEPARSFRMLIDNMPGLKIFEATVDHHRQVSGMLERLRGSKLTYVDASSLALMEQHRIRQVWATDRHLGLTGAEVFPRV